MKITIGYLYPDLLNLYGDSGNYKCLKYHLEEQGITVATKYYDLGSKKDFKNIDILYIGSGTEENLLLAIEDLKKEKNTFKKYLDDNKYILATGNSIEIFGKKIITTKDIECMGLFSYVTKYGPRIVRDVCEMSSVVNDNILGFENHYGFNNTDELIIKRHNFYGTYVIGPILVRNPLLCSCLVRDLINAKDKKFKIQEENYKLDREAYKINNKEKRTN